MLDKNGEAQFSTNGYIVIPQVVEPALIHRIADFLAADTDIEHGRQGKAFALRDVFARHATLLEMASSPPLLTAAQLLTGPKARPTKATFFDKLPEANWTLPLHQDLTITVNQAADVPGYTHWSTKAGAPHVQPPVAILENIIALRIHLDDCPAENGALEVVPGSHRKGRISPNELRRMHQEKEAVVCPAASGDILAMRPLLVHGSRKAEVPKRRRVLHIEYCGVDLDAPLSWPTWGNGD